ncbi:hypothetical protein C0Q70_06909 [Pomacea canaliculata]|uniref:Uncharacterized protein n=1 Tax=Pomacea canaliculata TaxID=400727 RepID=A0A2T7PDJ9_POMCA|nr:hypothetical protein C0Q70_06909 [Pomacea canaliculata]
MAFQTQGQSASLKSPAKPATNSPPATGVLFVPSPPPPFPGDQLFQSFPRHTRRRSSRRFHLFFHVSLPLIHPAKKVAAYFKTWLRDARDCYMRTSSGRLVDIPFHETILPPVTSHSVSAPPTPGASVDNSFHPDDCDDDDRKKLLGDDGGEDSDDVDRTCDRGAADEELGVTCPRGGATCCGRMAGLTPVALMWSLLSILVVGACGVSLFHPYWVMHPDRLHSFGLFTYCMRDMASTLPQAVCHGYGEAGGGRMELTRIPAGAWQASTLLFGGGVALEAVGALVTVVLLLLPSYGRHRLALLNGYLQTVAGESALVIRVCPLFDLTQVFVEDDWYFRSRQIASPPHT